MATYTKRISDAISRRDVHEVETLLEENHLNVIADRGGLLYTCEPDEYFNLLGLNNLDESGLTLLHHAVDSQIYELVELFFLGYGVKVDARSNTGLTPLHHAILGGDCTIVYLLLYHAADPRAEDAYGSIPFHYAADGGSRTIAHLLLKFGANIPDIPDKDEEKLAFIEDVECSSLLQCRIIDDAENATKPFFPIIINGNRLDDSISPRKGLPDTNYIVVQALRPVYFLIQECFEGMNLVICWRVSESTFVCCYQKAREHRLRLEEIGMADPIIYVDVYREELKVEPSLKGLSTNVEVDIVIFPGVDLTSEDLRARIAEKSGLSLQDIVFDGKKVRLTVPGPRISQIATIDEVGSIKRPVDDESWNEANLVH